MVGEKKLNSGAEFTTWVLKLKSGHKTSSSEGIKNCHKIKLFIFSTITVSESFLFFLATDEQAECMMTREVSKEKVIFLFFRV